MPRSEFTTAELRERLKLQRELNRELERTAKLEERIARARTSARTPTKTRRGAKPAPKAARAKPTTKRVRKAKRPSKSRAFEATHPRGPGGRFRSSKPVQQAQPSPLRRWALFIRPAYGKKAYPNEVIVLVLDKDPAEMPASERGAWLKAVRQARHKEDPKVRWVAEQGSGAWMDPTVAPGTWWVERRENLH